MFGCLVSVECRSVVVPERLAGDAVDRAEVVPVGSGGEIELQHVEAAAGLDDGGGDGLGDLVLQVREVQVGGVLDPDASAQDAALVSP